MACWSRPRAREKDSVVHPGERAEGLQDEVVGSEILRVLAHGPEALALPHVRRDGGHDPRGDAVLEREELAHLAVVFFRQHDCAGLGVTQLGGDAQVTGRPLHAAVHHVAHAQLAADRAHVDLGAAVAEGGAAEMTKTSFRPASAWMMLSTMPSAK